MTSLKYSSPFEAYEETGSGNNYYKQFKTSKPVIDQVYRVTGCGIITEHVKIVGIVEGVAIGRVIEDTNGGSQVGSMSMYHLEGLKAGWKYNENRSGYRLKELVK